MKTLTLFLSLLFAASLLFGQNPKLPTDSEDQETSPPCEPYVAANYDHASALLTLRIESCGLIAYFNCFGWCGTVDFAARKNQPAPQLVVGSLHGSIHYQASFESLTIPEEIRISSLRLTPGLYYVRLRGLADQDELYSKFLVK